MGIFYSALLNEYEEHRDFVKEEFYIEGEPMGTNEEKPNERQEPFMLDIENGGQDIYITARIISEEVRIEEEIIAASKIQKWYRKLKRRREKDAETHKVIIDTLQILNEENQIYKEEIDHSKLSMLPILLNLLTFFFVFG